MGDTLQFVCDPSKKIQSQIWFSLGVYMVKGTSRDILSDPSLVHETWLLPVVEKAKKSPLSHVMDRKL